MSQVPFFKISRRTLMRIWAWAIFGPPIDLSPNQLGQPNGLLRKTFLKSLFYNTSSLLLYSYDIFHISFFYYFAMKFFHILLDDDTKVVEENLDLKVSSSLKKIYFDLITLYFIVYSIHTST